MSFLNQLKGENDRRKYFMINLHERMLPTSAGVEPETSWSPVGWRNDLDLHCLQRQGISGFSRTMVNVNLYQQSGSSNLIG